MQRELEGEAPPTSAQTLLAFLERITLVADVDAVDANQGAVTLMTLHAAKGLEFQAVAMVGVEDGLLPHDRSQDSEQQIEEERRLCFVGMTRAMHHLMLCHAKYRTIFGQTMPTIPSRFLGELSEEPIELDDQSEDDAFAGGAGGTGRAQRGRASKKADQFAPGTRVRHPSFGLGEILHVDAVGAATKATVRFDEAGKKTLVLQYANLEKVG